MSATVTDLTPKLRLSTLERIATIRGRAAAEFAIAEQLRILADDHQAAATRCEQTADSISAELRKIKP